jgi:hypothetical protein
MSEEGTEISSTELQTSDSTHDKGGGSLWILWSVIGLLLAYPLSTGPVLKFCISKGRPPPVIVALYTPLETLYNKSSAAHKFFDWYFHLWGIK